MQAETMSGKLTVAHTELPKEGADRRMWVAEVLAGAPTAFARGSVSAALQRW